MASFGITFIFVNHVKALADVNNVVMTNSTPKNVWSTPRKAELAVVVVVAVAVAVVVAVCMRVWWWCVGGGGGL